VFVLGIHTKHIPALSVAVVEFLNVTAGGTQRVRRSGPCSEHKSYQKVTSAQKRKIREVPFARL